MPKKSSTHAAKVGRIKTLLRNNGHKDIDAVDMSTPKKLAQAVCKAFGDEDMSEYRRALSE